MPDEAGLKATIQAEMLVMERTEGRRRTAEYCAQGTEQQSANDTDIDKPCMAHMMTEACRVGEQAWILREGGACSHADEGHYDDVDGAVEDAHGQGVADPAAHHLRLDHVKHLRTHPTWFQSLPKAV